MTDLLDSEIWIKQDKPGSHGVAYHTASESDKEIVQQTNHSSTVSISCETAFLNDDKYLDEQVLGSNGCTVSNIQNSAVENSRNLLDSGTKNNRMDTRSPAEEIEKMVGDVKLSQLATTSKPNAELQIYCHNMNTTKAETNVYLTGDVIVPIMTSSQNVSVSTGDDRDKKYLTKELLLAQTVECRQCLVKPLANDCGDCTVICPACDACHASLTTEHQLIQLYVVCSILLLVFFPLFGIPALIFSVQSRRAHVDRRSEEVPRLARRALVYIVLGSLCLCAAIPVGCILAAYFHHSTAYTNVQGIPVVLPDVPDNSPAVTPIYPRLDVIHTSSKPQRHSSSSYPSTSTRNLLYQGVLAFVQGRHDNSVLQRGGLGQGHLLGDGQQPSDSPNSEDSRFDTGDQAPRSRMNEIILQVDEFLRKNSAGVVQTS